jgi:protein SCO1/2
MSTRDDTTKDTTEAVYPPFRVFFPVAFSLTLVLALGFAGFQFASYYRDARQQAPSLPRLLREPLPEFALIDSDAQPFGRADLAGRVWLADFIFTRCAGVCPALTSRLFEIQRRLQEALPPEDMALVRLVSFSVDPARDDPATLAAYAKNARALEGVWKFVTGGPGEVARLGREGFKLSSASGGEASEEILHSSKIVLVDGRGYVRAYYDGLGELAEPVDAIVDDVRALLPEIRGAAPERRDR